MKSIILLILTVSLFSFNFVFAIKNNPNDNHKIRRYSLIVGKNDGGRGRIKLSYATKDASSVSTIFEQLGGIDKTDNTLLLEPNKNIFLNTLSKMKRKIKATSNSNTRSEFFIYYSGHSDEEGLLLGREKIHYKELKKNILSIPADVSIVILDSCASGTLTKIKGGKHKAPFLSDDTSRLKGRVFFNL